MQEEVCVRIFKEKNNGHYYCVTCNRPTDGFVVTVVCGQNEDPGMRPQGDPNILSDIRNQPFFNT